MKHTIIVVQQKIIFNTIPNKSRIKLASYKSIYNIIHF
jgi:hypothetical protein